MNLKVLKIQQQELSHLLLNEALNEGLDSQY